MANFFSGNRTRWQQGSPRQEGKCHGRRGKDYLAEARLLASRTQERIRSPRSAINVKSA
jgi:hypothetical protein